MTALSIKDLAVSRGDRRLFSRLDLSVAAGEILHLRGRNGAGKTSLLETLVGLRLAAAGTIEQGPDASARHWLGHRSGLNPALSPVENLRFWCALNGESAEGVVPALSRLGLQAHRHRPVGALSTGQRRRAALARLVAVRRGWWFLDEPMAGIDAAGLDLIAELLGEHARAGGAAIVTSHQPLPADLPGLRIFTLGAAAGAAQP